VFADRFAGSLTDPVLDRKLSFAYSIHPMDYMV